MNGKEMVLQAMAGGKPEQIPVFISSYWDYWVRAVDANPLDWAYGGRDQRLGIEVGAARRHEGAFLHRTTGLTPGPIAEKKIPEGMPHPGSAPWTAYIEKYLPELVVFDEAPEAIVGEKKDIQRVIQGDKRISPGENTEYIEAVIKELGTSYLVAASGMGIFPHTRRCLGGVEKAMFALAENPGLVEAVMDALVEHIARRIPLLVSAGVEAVWAGAYNEGAEMINPKLWRKLIYPRHEKVVKMCHDHGIKVICWFLGDCMPLVEDLTRAGYDMLVLEQPRIGYRVDLKEIRDRVGNDLCISGWIPELAMLNDDRETIDRCIDEQVNAAGRDGAFIFSTSMLDSNVRPETADYFCAKVKEYRG